MPRPRKPVDMDALKRRAAQAQKDLDLASAQVILLQRNQEEARSKLSGLKMVLDECKNDLDKMYEFHAMGETTKEQLAAAKLKYREAEKNLKHHEDLINACSRAQKLVHTKISQAVNIKNGASAMLHRAVAEQIREEIQSDAALMDKIAKYQAAYEMIPRMGTPLGNNAVSNLFEKPQGEAMKHLQQEIRTSYGIANL